MTLELAMRITEMLLGFALLQQSAEHLTTAYGAWRLFLLRALLAVLLLMGVYTSWACLALMGLSLGVLQRFHGPYNGGSDGMGLLILWCLGLAHFMPKPQWSECLMGYLALQLVLSYFMAGWVKIVNPEWRSGRALRDVFAFTAYPVSESLRGWAQWPRLLWVMSWLVMLFELLFPLALFSHVALIVALLIAATFHLANAFLFGLNRFFWTWLAAYPSLLWLQGRVLGALVH